MMNPTISVLLPVYKTNEKYLQECVNSLLVQTFDDFELLIVDDCPEDAKVEEIIRGYTDERIKYSRNPVNLGISATRNKLLDLSRGKYLAVMDHDDISRPTRFEEQVSFLENHPEVGVVGTWYQRFPKLKIKKKPTDNDEIAQNLFYGCPILHPSSMIRKSVLTDNNIRYEAEFSPAEDLALWCELSKVTQLANIPKVLFNYRDYGENTSKRCYDKLISCGTKARERLKVENPELWARTQAKAKKKHKFFAKKIFPIADGYERDYNLFCLPLIKEVHTTSSCSTSFLGIKFFEEIYNGNVTTQKYFSIPTKKIDFSIVLKKAVDFYKKHQKKPLVVYFDHALGGGTDTYFKNQLKEFSESYDLIRIQYLCKKLEYKISFYSTNFETISVRLRNIDNFKKYIKDFHPQEIVVNSLVSYANAEDILQFVSELKKEIKNIKVSARGHDFNPICPSFNLLSSQNKFCGLPDADCCKKCFQTLRLSDNPVQHRNLMSGAKDIASWRKNWQDFYENTADELVVFGEAIKDIFVKAYPNIEPKITIIPHKVAPLREVNPPKHEGINICILGNIKLISKGRQIVKDMANFCADKKVNIIVLGGFEKEVKNITNIGKYQRNELPNIIEKQKIDLVFIPSIWPETFSYTTAEAMLMGLPVACFDIGTPAERVKKYDKGLIISKIDAQTAFDEIVDYVNRIRNES